VDEANFWWQVEVAVPPTAYTLDFAISNDAKDSWDNNMRQDYRLQVEAGEEASDAAWAALQEARFKVWAYTRPLLSST